MRETDEGCKEGNKEKATFSPALQFELILSHLRSHVTCACSEFSGEIVHCIERSGLPELNVICEKLVVYRIADNDI